MSDNGEPELEIRSAREWMTGVLTALTTVAGLSWAGAVTYTKLAADHNLDGGWEGLLLAVAAVSTLFAGEVWGNRYRHRTAADHAHAIVAAQTEHVAGLAAEVQALRVQLADLRVMLGAPASATVDQRLPEGMSAQVWDLAMRVKEGRRGKNGDAG